MQEGLAKLNIQKPTKISKELDVFYNPIMEFNRSVSIALLNSLDRKDMQIADPLAGSGVRSLRFLLELKKGILKHIAINDVNIKAVKEIKTNLKINKIDTTKIIKEKRMKNGIEKKLVFKKIEINNKEANNFLLDSNGFDYIDIDPFGPPIKFLDSAIQRLARDGILAVTATDTGALSGSFESACLRKYWALPLHNSMQHEIGLRILIRRVQLAGTPYDRALIPILSYSKEHYMRVFFSCSKGKTKADEVLRQHDFFNYEDKNYGPIWTGQLHDSKLIPKIIEEYERIYEKVKDKDKITEIEHELKFLNIIKEESKVNQVGFYDVHTIAGKYKIDCPSKEDILKELKKRKIKVASSHCLGTGIKADCNLKIFTKIIQDL